ncbi:MAG: RHS repeat-associated core domain-containing protein [Eubacteriales bacterium]|nr:RHS repeat-associated core domain-containing protein [Eubacteriales bacterium]
MGLTRRRGLRSIASALRRKLISSVASPLRKKSCLLRLFACKRTLNASASLPTFCEYGTGTLATSLGANQPFRYRGYVYDSETQWYYLQSRYYNPEVGRFLSSDVLLSTGQGVLGHNSYAYCLNNPINMSDPSGRLCRSENAECTDGKNNVWKELRIYRKRLFFSSMDDAAEYFAKQANYLTMSLDREVCAVIYYEQYFDAQTNKYANRYYLSNVFVGEHDNVIGKFLTYGSLPNVVAFVHTHPYCNGHTSGANAYFSTGDCFVACNIGYCYMSDVASGNLYKISWTSGFNGMFNDGIACSSLIPIRTGLPIDTTQYICVN